jgi:hypothetical protein
VEKPPQQRPVQVAEQYAFQPLHAARLAFAHSGKLGDIRQVQISVVHGYHGIALIRKFLNIGYENAVIRAFEFSRLLVRGELGEINNLDASFLSDFRTPIRVRFDRIDAGQAGNLEGYYHKGYSAGDLWWYQNPFAPGRLPTTKSPSRPVLVRWPATWKQGTLFTVWLRRLKTTI